MEQPNDDDDDDDVNVEKINVNIINSAKKLAKVTNALFDSTYVLHNRQMDILSINNTLNNVTIDNAVRPLYLD